MNVGQLKKLLEDNPDLPDNTPILVRVINPLHDCDDEVYESLPFSGLLPVKGCEFKSEYGNDFGYVIVKNGEGRLAILLD